MALLDDMKDMKARLTKLESRDTRGLLGKLFGKGSAAAVLLAVFLIGGPAWAQTEPMVLVLAPGQLSCGAWFEAKEKGEGTLKRQIFLVWANGYLTAYSQWEEEGSGPVSSLHDAKGAHAWIDNFCQERPLADVATAAMYLVACLASRRCAMKAN